MNKIISFPHISFYYIPIKYMIKKITKCEVIVPRLNNKETVSLGSIYSPQAVCMPFKYNLGNYIDALNKGANILIQGGGGCRYGYYAELQEQILKELGYNFTFINLIKNNHISIKKLYLESKKINKKLNLITYLYYLIQGCLTIIFMDKITKYIREHKALTSNPKLYDKVLTNLKQSYSIENLNIIKIIKIYKKMQKELKSITINNNSPIRILLIGELYTLMDSEASNHLEESLINNNTIVYRYTDLTYLLFKKKFNQRKILKSSKKYLKYSLGADGAESVFHTLNHCKNGIDGIIHIKSYSCVPELNAIPILNQISEDYQVPILYLSFDGENNISNIDTKIEAFYDMIISKKNKNNNITENK